MSDEDPSVESFRMLARADARDVVSDALGWYMPTERWLEVDELVTAMEAALALDQNDDLAAIATELELMGPPRVIRVGTSPVPAPPDLADRIAVLVHALGAPIGPAAGGNASDQARQQ